MVVRAYCPGHISGFFKRVTGENRDAAGSVGAGIVIDPGVTVTLSPARTTSVQILQQTVHGHRKQVADHSPPVASVLNRLGVDARVVTECSLPIGAGFGLSAAALLATITAANRAFELDLGVHEIARIAHETEISHRTGLGDVAACQGGGRVLRTGPGIDGSIERFFDIQDPVYAVSFGPIDTPTVLGSAEQMERVFRAFPTIGQKTTGAFFLSCREFSRKSGLETGRVQKVLRVCTAENVTAAMTMLGEGVFACGARAGAVLRPFGHVYMCRMARGGPRVVQVDP